MAPGPSSILSKAVSEQFAHRFLRNPSVVLLSESGNKLVHEDKELLDSIGLNIQEDQSLPDLILVDAGAITESRQADLLRIATDAGFSENRVTFVSAFEDRDHPAFRQELGSLAWKSFAWFMSEPNNIVLMYGSHDTVQPTMLSDLMVMVRRA